MLRMRKALALTLITALILTSFPIDLASAALPSSVLFLSHFDNTTKNERNGNVGTFSGISYASGKFSKGVKFNETDSLYYSSTGNVSPTVGTVEFWYKPTESWGEKSDAQVQLFHYDDNDQDTGWTEDWISVFGSNSGYPNQTALYAEMVVDGGTYQQKLSYLGAASWGVGSLHHIAITWSSSAFKLYVDGTLRDQIISPSLPPSRDTIFVGCDMYWEDGYGADGVIDELLIVNWAKSDSEIESDYKATKPFYTEEPSPPPSEPPSPPPPPPLPEDVEPPKIRWKAYAPVYKTKNVTISGRVSDNQSGVASLSYTLDGKNFIPMRVSDPFKIRLKNLKDGNYRLRVKAADRAGNETLSTLARFVVDTLPPHLGGNAFFLGPQKLFPTENGFLSVSSGAEVSMIVSAVGGPMTVKVRIGESLASLQPLIGTNLWKGQIAFEEEGSFNLEATSTDGAGNVVVQNLSPIYVSAKGMVGNSSGEPLEGVLVSLYVPIGGTISGEWELWEAEVYGQENPQETDGAGSFSYFAPSGTYQLRVSAAGYREFVSEPFTLEKPQPINPSITMESRPALNIFGRRFTLPWFLDIFAKRREIALELPTGEVTPTDLGVGKRAPDFTLPSTLGGKTQLEMLRRRKVLLTFWTTWDPLSVEQMAILDKLSIPRGVAFTPVALQESLGRVTSFLGRGGYFLPSLVDENGVLLKDYRVLSIPQHFLVGEDGRIKEVRVGVIGSEELLELVAD